MPIRPSERARYPKDWPAISRRIRERDGNACKWCLVPNGVVIYRAPGVYVLEDGDTRDEKTGEHLTWTRGSELGELGEGRFVRVVLTVAHLDHTPEHNDDANLAALCQRCHLTYDAKHHAATARATRDEKRGQGSLF